MPVARTALSRSSRRLRRAALAALLIAAPLAAQPPPRFTIQRWNTSDGLPSQFVSDLAQTGDGFIWLLAARSVVRFDGLRFTVFRPGQVPGFPESEPLGLTAGRGDTLWIVTNAGELIAAAGGRFAVSARGWPKMVDVAADSSGRVWAWGQTRIGLKRDTTFSLVAETPFMRMDDRPAAVASPDGGLWVGEPVLQRFDTTGRQVPLGPSDSTIVLDTRTGTPVVRRRRAGRIELERITGEPLGRIPYDAQRMVRLIDRRGRIWASVGSTIEVFEPDGGAPLATFSLGAGVAALQLVADREGGIWVATDTEGLAKVEEVPFVHVGQAEGLRQRQVRDVTPGPAGTVFVIDYALRAYRATAERAVPLPVDQGPFRGLGISRAMFAVSSPDGVIWLGLGNEDSLWLVSSAARQRDQRVAVPVPLREWSAVADPGASGAYWLAGQGLFRFSASDGVDVARLGPPVLDRGWTIRDLAFAGDTVWALSPDSIARIHGDQVAVFGRDSAAVRGQLRSIHREADGTIWVGSYRGGIARFRAGRFEPVTERDGLGENIVSRILPDGLGNLWMAGDRSIHRVSLAELHAFLEGTIPRVNGVRYDRDDGIPNPEASAGLATAAPDGTLWFPTFDGVVAVNPQVALGLGAEAPAIRMTGVEIGGRSVATGDTVSLPGSATPVAVEFSAVSLRTPGGMLVEYAIDEGERAWRNAGDLRRIEFGSLAAGRHTFRLRARSAGGAWAPTQSLTLIVPPRFRDTAAFYLLLVGGLTLLAAGGARLRSRRAVARAVELQRTVDERTRDLQDEKRRTEQVLNQVAWQAEQLAEADRERTRFYTNVTHELRTPLTLILGPLDDLARGKRGRLPETALEDVTIVRQNASRLKQLVDELLELNRIGAGSRGIRIVQVNVADLLRRVTAPFETHARSAGKTFQVVLDVGGPEAWCDPDCLETVVTNLLGNAFNYTPAGGQVALRAARDDGEDWPRLVITVADTGKGIPAGELDRIFDRFHRVDEEHRGAPAGSGLGLALVKELVGAHGGSIGVRSELGRGTEFTVSIPVGERRDDEAPVRSDDAEAERPTVIVVEDHPDMRAFVARQLAAEYRVIEAANGHEGLEQARAVVPDAVVSDLMMPGMNGEELCQRLKADPDLDFVPVILLTAKVAQESRLEGLRRGADAYLTKPFDSEELRLTVRNAVGSRRRLRERLAAAGQTVPAAPSPEPVAEVARDPEAERMVARFQAAVAERIGDEDLDVPALARALDMSRSTIYRRTQDVFGRAPMEVVWDLRLQQGASWLQSTDATVAEVAYGVGFKSVSHFTRRFRERYGVTPAAYRRAADGRDS